MVHYRIICSDNKHKCLEKKGLENDGKVRDIIGFVIKICNHKHYSDAEKCFS